MKAAIVYGPQGCGKTLHAATLRRLLGLVIVVDEWAHGDPVTPGAVHLTHDEPPFDRAPAGTLVLAFSELLPLEPRS